MRTALLLIALSFTVALPACGPTGKCADAVDRAAACGVPDLELEDDLAGCGVTWECRSSCVLEAPCDEIKASFGSGTDRTTAVWKCYEKCGI
jgi:hypothetical protein